MKTGLFASRPAVLLALAGVALASATVAHSSSSSAANPPAAAAKPAAPETPAPAVSSLATMLEGLRWGMNHVEVTKHHNQVNGVFDREYNPQLAKMQPGTRMTHVEAERENKKLVFANSFIEFKTIPLGYDTTGLKGEYSYNNKEFLQVLDREGKRRLFFYIGATPGERLWKIYDEVRYAEGGALGKNYQEAVQKMNEKLGVNGRARNADDNKGFPLPFTEWADGTTHLRLVDRATDRVVGLVLEDKNTLANIKALRPNKLEDPTAMDPAIEAITKGGVSDPNAKPQDAGAKPKDAGPAKKK